MRTTAALAGLWLVATGLCTAQPAPLPFTILDPTNSTSVDVSTQEVVRLAGMAVDMPATVPAQLTELDENLPVVRSVASVDRSWLRLRFSIEGDGFDEDALLIVRSISEPTNQQTFTAATFIAWKGHTVAFNGTSSGTEVELLYLDTTADPLPAKFSAGIPASEALASDAPATETAAISRLRTQAGRVLSTSRFQIETDLRSVIEPPLEPRVPFGLCISNQDRRAPSNNPWVARILSRACTAFMIEANKFLTANHCISGDVDLVQFNVPDAFGNGLLQMPTSDDQYLIDKVERSCIPIGDNCNDILGDDWAVFSVLPNTETGLLPSEKQGCCFEIMEEVDPMSAGMPELVTVTGYGWTGDNRLNRTQQSHSGSLEESIVYLGRPVLRYRVDTHDFNSGSPIISMNQGLVVGIHTHAGCQPGDDDSANKGTWIHSEELAQAISDFDSS